MLLRNVRIYIIFSISFEWKEWKDWHILATIYKRIHYLGLVKMSKLLGQTTWSGLKLQPVHLSLWISMVICHFVYRKIKIKMNNVKLIKLRGMLAIHLLTHTFQHTLFDWLKFTCDPPNSQGTHMIWWDPCEF